MDLRGTSALVTGASQGLGAALLRRLAGAGAKVVGVARTEERLKEAVDAARAEGGQVHGVVADVGDKEAIWPLAGTAAQLVGPIDLLIHNASTLGPVPMPLLMDTECEDLQRVLEVNLLGPFRLTRAVAGSMALRGRGLVLHLSSDAAVAAYAGWGAYGVSKAAQDHLARILAAELAGTGVTVLCVDPGEMDTAMHRDAMPDADPATLARPDEVARRLVDLVRRSTEVQSGARVLAGEWSASK